MGKWSEEIKIPCLSDMSLAVSEQFVGTFDLGKFLDDLNVSKGFTGGARFILNTSLGPVERRRLR
jgi:hypothetical protein